jgi:hypothetical protein
MSAPESTVTSLDPLGPSTLEQTRLNADLVQQLVMKTLYFGGELTTGLTLFR